jgi:hypothetical protein
VGFTRRRLGLADGTVHPARGEVITGSAAVDGGPAGLIRGGQPGLIALAEAFVRCGAAGLSPGQPLVLAGTPWLGATSSASKPSAFSR